MAWRQVARKILRRFIVVIEFHWPTIGQDQRYRVRPMRHDEMAVLIWTFYGAKLSSDQIQAVLQKMLGTGQVDSKNVKSAVKHCESVVTKMDESWGPLLTKIIQ